MLICLCITSCLCICLVADICHSFVPCFVLSLFNLVFDYTRIHLFNYFSIYRICNSFDAPTQPIVLYLSIPCFIHLLNHPVLLFDRPIFPFVYSAISRLVVYVSLGSLVCLSEWLFVYFVRSFARLFVCFLVFLFVRLCGEGHMPIMDTAAALVHGTCVAVVWVGLLRSILWKHQLAAQERIAGNTGRRRTRNGSLNRTAVLPLLSSPAARGCPALPPYAMSTTQPAQDQQRWQEFAHIIETLAGQVQARDTGGRDTERFNNLEPATRQIQETVSNVAQWHGAGASSIGGRYESNSLAAKTVVPQGLTNRANFKQWGRRYNLPQAPRTRGTTSPLEGRKPTRMERPRLSQRPTTWRWPQISLSTCMRACC